MTIIKVKDCPQRPFSCGVLLTVTSLEVFLVAFGIYNFRMFFKHIRESNAMVLFYVFSILCLVTSTLESWYAPGKGTLISERTATLIVHYTYLSMVWCQII
jgi:hypothetical protein